VSVDTSLILEILKAVRADTAALRDGQEDIKVRLTTLEIGQAAIHSLIGHVAGDQALLRAERERGKQRDVFAAFVN
jgi:hypothetical protein